MVIFLLSKNFIAATREYSEYWSHIPAPYLRKNIEIKSEIEKAKITICGLGFYELFINGQKITKGLLAPYISNPDDILYYDEYDLKELLLNGKNTVAIMLGNGMLNCPGGTVWDFQLTDYRSAPKVALAVEITYTNGSSEVIEADESFKVHPSPVLFDDLRCGEFYDANMEIEGWNLPNFDDSEWNNAISAETPRGFSKLCEAEPIVTIKTLTPVSIKSNVGIQYPENPISPNLSKAIKDKDIRSLEPISNGYLYDFGENLAGNIVLKIKGEKGQKVTVVFGEILNANGDLDMRGITFQPNSLNLRIEYTLKGDGVEEYRPTFTYMGFRYCVVDGITEEQAVTDLLTYEVMSSNLKKNGDFYCSDEVANKLQKATYNSDIANFFYFPTDCPHREKNGWTADAALSVEQMLFNLTPEKSFSEWLVNIRAAQRSDGALPGIVPTGGWGYVRANGLSFGPGWDSVLFYLPYYTWLMRGDTKIIKENATAMMNYLNYIANWRDEKGLLHIGLGDWLPIKYKTDITPLEVADTLVTMNLCKLASKMFCVVNLTIQKEFADGLFNELRASAREILLMDDGATVFGRTQTGQAMAIEYGLFDDGEKKAAFDVLLDIIHEADDHLDTGCLGARIIFHTLAKYGYADLAYKMIVRPDYPSYGYWIVEEDATSLFEAFLKPGTPPICISKNHHFFGDISSWFFKYIAGVKINPFAKCVNEIEISPNFIGGLDYADGYQYHLGGKISSHWEKDGNNYKITIKMPKGCFGKLIPPEGYILCDEKLNLRNFMQLTSGEQTYTMYKK